jgi:O-antigen/teichoic acid export membrane protein
VVGHRLIVNYIGQGWTALIGIIFVPLYISYLGVEAFGIVGLYTVLQGLASLLGGGMFPALGRTMARYSGGAVSAQSLRDLLRSAETLALGVAVGIALVLWMASGWLADHWLRVDTLPREAVSQAITVMGIMVACRFVESVYLSSLVGLQRQVLLNIVTTVGATVRAVGVLAVLAWYSPTIEAYFAWQAIVSVVSLIVLALVAYSVMPVANRPGRFSLETIREVMPFAGGMLTLTVLGLLHTQGDKLLLSRLLPLSEYGLYTFAGMAAHGVILMTVPVLQSWYPRLIELQSRQEQASLARAFHACAQVQTVVTGSLGLVLATFSTEIIDIWTGNPELEPAAKLVSILVVGNIFNALSQVPSLLQIAHGFTRLLMQMQIMLLVVMFPVLYAVATTVGTVGAATVWMASNICYFLFCTPYLFRNTLAGDKWRWYRDDIARPLAAAGLVILAARLWVPFPDSAAASIVVLGVISGTAILAAAMTASATRSYLLVRLRPWLSRSSGV